MKKFYYMASGSIGISEVYAHSFFAAWAGIKYWFLPGTTFVIWDENDNIRIFHGGK